MSFETVLKDLHGLRPDGPEGFEGLVARLLERLTSQRFLLARSGRQDGKDLASDSRTGNRLAVECKRYLDSTPLPRMNSWPSWPMRRPVPYRRTSGSSSPPADSAPSIATCSTAARRRWASRGLR